MSETARLADQARRAFKGEAWHGDSLLDILSDVDAATASVRPIENAHSIWELVLHIAAWDGAVIRRTEGIATELTDEQNFPSLTDTSQAAWQRTVRDATKVHEEMAQAITSFPDSRLGEQVPGKAQPYYNFFYLFAGIVQHEIYHAGQIALLKKAAKASR